MRSRKERRRITFDVSIEVYDQINTLSTGKNAPFRSTGDYMRSLVYRDLGKRDMKMVNDRIRLEEILDRPGVTEAIIERIKQQSPDA